MAANGEIEGEENGIQYRIVREADVDRVADFCFSSFMQEEPCCQARGGQSEHPAVRAHVKEMLSSGSSMMAVEKTTNEVIGHLISYPHYKKDLTPRLSLKDYLTRFPGQTWAYSNAFWDASAYYGDIYDKFPEIDCLQALYGLSCMSNHQHRGIGFNLIARTCNLAKKNQIHALECIATSLYTQKILNKLGFIQLRELRFDTFEQDGEQFYPNGAKVNWQTITSHTRLTNN